MYFHVLTSNIYKKCYVFRVSNHSYLSTFLFYTWVNLTPRWIALFWKSWDIIDPKLWNFFLLVLPNFGIYSQCPSLTNYLVLLCYTINWQSTSRSHLDFFHKQTISYYHFTYISYLVKCTIGLTDSFKQGFNVTFPHKPIC